VVLRLAIGRQGVGLELARPARVGCLAITELTATLPGTRFPVDVTGGVPRFRHRRGRLQTLTIELDARVLERWAAPRLRGLVGTQAPEVWVAVRPAGATVCVSAGSDDDDGTSAAPPRRGPHLGATDVRRPVVAFEVEAIGEKGDLAFVVERARGTGLPAPPTAVAIACLEAILRGVARRNGAMFVVVGGPGALARALLPEAGARVPATENVRWASLSAHADAWILHAAHDALAASPTEEALRAREIAGIVREGDDAMVRGDLVRARGIYVEALARAPRHGEIARRILEIDARTPGRAHAALATLAEARDVGETVRFGTIPGELLAEVDDVDAALASLERAGDTEPAPALAAAAFEIAASITRDAEDASRWLDKAVARAPYSPVARWSRVRRRLELRRVEDALADVEHLDALARDNRAKLTVWLRAGQAWQSAGLGAWAGAIFERALRYAPDEPQALAGLGTALVGEGREARGVALLAHAIELAEARDVPSSQGDSAGVSAMLLELARALAERLDDLSTAVARIAAIPSDAREAPLARGLEGRWRAKLGDVAGAALAFARLRELAASLAPPTDDPHVSMWVALLVEAAELHRSRLHDALGAQRHLAVALRLRPWDAELRRAYREVGELVARGDKDGASPAPAGARSKPDGASPAPAGARSKPGEAEPAPASSNEMNRPLSIDLGLGAETESSDDEVRAGVRVEELTRRLHGEPQDDAAADELASLLESLGRGHELLALLSARLEDATLERRAELAPRARAALARLAVEAEAAGRLEEAALYRGAMEALPS
jgi:tetratricopeptide (TPR) repeat protein